MVIAAVRTSPPEDGCSDQCDEVRQPAVDKLIDQAAGETDEAKRKQPLVFAHYEALNCLPRKQVVGSTINPTLELRLENVSMA